MNSARGTLSQKQPTPPWLPFSHPATARYGGGKCLCPAARHRPGRPGDLHCACTRFTPKTVFATALGRPIPVELVETVRRGGENSHLVARLG